MKDELAFALLFALDFFEASVIVTITAMRHSEPSIQISDEVFKHLFVLKSSLA